jgi:hypothetical protein
MGGNVPAQVEEATPNGGVTGIVIVIVGVARVKGKVKGCHMALRLVCDCVLD